LLAFAGASGLLGLCSMDTVANIRQPAAMSRRNLGVRAVLQGGGERDLLTTPASSDDLVSLNDPRGPVVAGSAKLNVNVNSRRAPKNRNRESKKNNPPRALDQYSLASASASASVLSPQRTAGNGLEGFQVDDSTVASAITLDPSVASTRPMIRRQQQRPHLGHVQLSPKKFGGAKKWPIPGHGDSLIALKGSPDKFVSAQHTSIVLRKRADNLAPLSRPALKQSGASRRHVVQALAPLAPHIKVDPREVARAHVIAAQEGTKLFKF
jgi:hypothetical protein